MYPCPIERLLTMTLCALVMRVVGAMGGLVGGVAKATLDAYPAAGWINHTCRRAIRTA
jgi:hypothetical protein